jgi:hypothetical protein
MGIYFFKEEAVEKMVADIPLNKNKYLFDGFLFEDLTGKDLSFESKGQVNHDLLKAIKDPDDTSSFEVDNSITVFRAFEEITRYQASDIRMWAFYCHAFATNYSRSRYPQKFNDQANSLDFVNSVRMHYLGGSQSRELLRNNLLARLWWNYRLVKDVNESIADELLQVLLVNSDHRNSFVERPTQFSSNSIKAALMFSHYKYSNDKDDVYFDAPRGSKEEIRSTKHYNYRTAARYLNLLGGTMNLNLLTTEDILGLIFEDEQKFYARNFDNSSES